MEMNSILQNDLIEQQIYFASQQTDISTQQTDISSQQIEVSSQQTDISTQQIDISSLYFTSQKSTSEYNNCHNWSIVPILLTTLRIFTTFSAFGAFLSTAFLLPFALLTFRHKIHCGKKRERRGWGLCIALFYESLLLLLW
jgi:hypothetical protein